MDVIRYACVHTYIYMSPRTGGLALEGVSMYTCETYIHTYIHTISTNGGKLLPPKAAPVIKPKKVMMTTGLLATCI